MTEKVERNAIGYVELQNNLFDEVAQKNNELEAQIEELQDVRAGQAKLLNQDTERIMTLEAQIEKMQRLLEKYYSVLDDLPPKMKPFNLVKEIEESK